MEKAEIARLRKMIRKIENREPASVNAVKTKSQNASKIKGNEIENSAGKFLEIEEIYPLSYIHGNDDFSKFPDIKMNFLSTIARDNRFDDLIPEDIAFIDTESTGISGTGTYLFLIGIAYLKDDRIILKQYLMRDFNEEESMLVHLNEFLDNFKAFVSFNGKTFDIPNIESRLILSRIMKDMRGVPHLDLLHPARRLWKRKFDSFKLTALERELLNFHREGDIPSELIPQVYFDYVRTGNTSRMSRVIEHNKFDIISMISLLVKEAEVISDYSSQTFDVMFNVGRFYENRGKINKAINIYSMIHEAGETCVKEFFILGSCRLAYIYKKLELKDDSLEIWEKLKDFPTDLGPEPFLELAKFYEHFKKDIPRALELSETGLEISKKIPKFEPFQEDFKKRLERLKNKLDKQNSKKEVL